MKFTDIDKKKPQSLRMSQLEMNQYGRAVEEGDGLLFVRLNNNKYYSFEEGIVYDCANETETYYANHLVIQVSVEEIKYQVKT